MFMRKVYLSIKYKTINYKNSIYIYFLIICILSVLISSFFRNPWSCDKLTYDLQIYLTRKNIQYYAVCAKSAESKKFEKMIVYDPRIKYEKRWPLINLNSNIKKNVTKKHFTSTPVHENTITCVTTTDKTNFTKALNSISPYWFLVAGFLLGIASGMLICYMWITRKICRCSRQIDNDAQRVSLLQNLWQFEDPLNDTAISCPDTPPPPYREVMLQPRLYRNISVTTNLNNNVATNNIEYT